MVEALARRLGVTGGADRNQLRRIVENVGESQRVARRLEGSPDRIPPRSEIPAAVGTRASDRREIVYEVILRSDDGTGSGPTERLVLIRSQTPISASDATRQALALLPQELPPGPPPSRGGGLRIPETPTARLVGVTQGYF